jgi:acetyl-CoA acetyltransferase
MHDVLLCLGAEKLTHPTDKTVGMDAIGTAVDVELRAELATELGEHGDGSQRSFFMDLYAGMARDYMRASGATARDFALVTVKNQHNGARNPRAQYGSELTVDDVLASRAIVAPLTLLMCSPISDGAAAALLVSGEPGMDRGPGVRVLASVARSAPVDGATSVTSLAAAAAYDAAGLGPPDLDCVEVHDAAASAELVIYEQLGLAEPGAGAALIRGGDTDLGGRLPVNTSGGLLARGHPIGATGLAQIVEVVLQLRSAAGDRQVPRARVALTQNAGGWHGADNVTSVIHIFGRRAA